MSAAVRRLGTFSPSEWQPDTIEQEFRRLACLAECCRRERVSVRIPQGIAPHQDNLEWHQDGGGPLGTTKHMVVWASEAPTELKDEAGAVVEVQIGDVTWFDNTVAWHRQPRGTDESTRWFVAIRCSGELI